MSLAPSPDATTAPKPRPAKAASPLAPLWQVLSAVASLKVTVALFVLSVLLVFFGTLAQMNAGIWEVIDGYFWSYFVWVKGQLFVQFLQIFFEVSPNYVAPSWLGFPLPGGYLLGLLMLVNLLAAHLTRFRAGQTLKELKAGFAKGAGPGLLAFGNVALKRGGIWAIHTGLILLYVGEYGTRQRGLEQQMTIAEVQARNYAVDSRSAELAFIDGTKADTDRVTVVPAATIAAAARSGAKVTHPELPFDVAVVKYYANGDIDKVGPAMGENPATAGIGLRSMVVPAPETSGVDQKQRADYPAAYVTLYPKGSDRPLGTYLVSALLETMERPAEMVGEGGDGRPTHRMEMRHTRHYKPFSLRLEKFSFVRHPGTNTPQSYSSRLRLVDPELNEDREVTISMNDPLRHRGETFYQASFTPDERGTVLQVVANPVWWMPYAACAVVTLGLLVHFGYYLVLFLLRTLVGRSAPRVAGAANAAAPTYGSPTTAKEVALGFAAVALLGVLYYGGYVMRTTPKTTLDLREVATLPVLEGGRVMPFDTFARLRLRTFNHGETFQGFQGAGDEPRSALEWMLDLASTADDPNAKAKRERVFKVENDQLFDLLKLERRQSRRYSLAEILGTPGNPAPGAAAFVRAVRKAGDADDDKRDLFQKKLLEFAAHVQAANTIMLGGAPIALPDRDAGGPWHAPGAADREADAQTRERLAQLFPDAQSPEEMKKLMAEMTPQDRGSVERMAQGIQRQAAERYPSAALWEALLEAYRQKDQEKLNEAARAIRQAHEANAAAARERGLPVAVSYRHGRLTTEARYNAVAPFFHLIWTYLFMILLTAAGWALLFVRPTQTEGLRRAVFWTLLAAFVVHTASLVLRMYLTDRWFVFVTNLYSSAIFIGWASVGLGLVIEKLFPTGLGNFVAGLGGGLATLVSHYLASSGGGDTMGSLEAVLDTDIWLATHVTTVTFGYAATFVAGILGIVYLALDLTSDVLNRPMVLGRGASARPMTVGKALGMLTYGVVCFALLLSFVGTVLGGIWADQSWGRFWGWDPKENGAVLIVVWNALILHARWGGMVKDRGVAVLALVGNMITTWSWFGTNQLGVGLHAYGFNKELALGCRWVWMLHLAGIAAALGMYTFDRVTGAKKAFRV